MIKVKIIALGKLKEQYLSQASAEYQKRLKNYCNLEIVEITPKSLSDNPSNAEINAALEKEADLILQKIPNNAYILPLCIEGKQFSSEEFSQKIENSVNLGKSTVVFIIGSSHGLSERVKQRANVKISFSKMTFPHMLARIMLLEQIYRAFKIKEGSAYHK